MTKQPLLSNCMLATAAAGSYGAPPAAQAHAERAIVLGNACAETRFTMANNDTLAKIARRMGLPHPAPLLALNSCVYLDLVSSFQKTRNTTKLKFDLLLPTPKYTEWCV